MLHPVGDLLRLNAAGLPEEEALVMGDVRLTYPELNRRVNTLASALAARGVRHGDRVAVLARNSIPYVELYFATAKLGAILVPLNFWHRAGEHGYVLADAEPRLLCHEPEFAGVLDDAVTEAGVVVDRVRITPGVDDAVAEEEWTALLAAASSDEEPTTPPAPDDAHMILYTSGTTGRPKGALLSHGRTVADAYGMASVLGLRQSDTFANYFPPFHVGNWDHQKYFFLVGARVVLLREYDPGVLLRLVERERLSVLLSVPTMLHALLEHPDFTAADKSSVRLVYYGAYDPSGIMRRTAEAFGAEEGRVDLLHCYGLTEGGPIVTVCQPQDVLSHWGSIGRPAPGVEVRLADDDGNPVPPGEPGEIWARGPVMSGYWRRPDESAAALAAGWLHTGDVAVADADGFMRLVDRKKDMIRSGGQNVYSKEVEDVLATHPGVEQAAVIGLPDPVYEELVCAVVVRGPHDGTVDDDAFAEQLRRHVRSRSAGYNVPKQVRVVDALPKNAVGKTLKHELRAQFGSMFAEATHGGG